MTTFVKIVGGVVVQKQHYTEDGFVEAPDNVVCGMLFDGEEYSNPPTTTPVEPPVSVQQIAAARLFVDGWDVTGIERSQGFSGAFMIDENVVWAFFTEPQEDNHYMVTPNINVTKYDDYIEIDSTNLSDIRFVVQRVQ